MQSNPNITSFADSRVLCRNVESTFVFNELSQEAQSYVMSHMVEYLNDDLYSYVMCDVFDIINEINTSFGVELFSRRPDDTFRIKVNEKEHRLIELPHQPPRVEIIYPQRVVEKNINVLIKKVYESTEFENVRRFMKLYVDNDYTVKSFVDSVSRRLNEMIKSVMQLIEDVDDDTLTKNIYDLLTHKISFEYLDVDYLWRFSEDGKQISTPLGTTFAFIGKMAVSPNLLK